MGRPCRVGKTAELIAICTGLIWEKENKGGIGSNIMNAETEIEVNIPWVYHFSHLTGGRDEGKEKENSILRHGLTMGFYVSVRMSPQR